RDQSRSLFNSNVLCSSGQCGRNTEFSNSRADVEDRADLLLVHPLGNSSRYVERGPVQGRACAEVVGQKAIECWIRSESAIAESLVLPCRSLARRYWRAHIGRDTGSGGSKGSTCL